MIDGNTYYDNTIALLHSDGNLLDSSKLAKIYTGNAVISTSQSKFGIASLYTQSGYFQSEPSADFILVGDFTLECFVRSPSNGGSGTIACVGIYTQGILFRADSIYINGTPLFGGWMNANLANTWYHVALVRHAGVITVYIGGIAVGTYATSSSINAAGGAVMIGGSIHTGGGENWYGWIDEFALINCAKYTGNFTPPAAAFLDARYFFELTISLTKYIAATQFKATCTRASDNSLVGQMIVTEGNSVFTLKSNEPVAVTLSPIQGEIWKPATVYALNALVFPTNPSATPYYYKRIAAGTSGSTEPSWSETGNDGLSSSAIYTLKNDAGEIIETRSAKGTANDGSVTGAWERVARLAQPITHGPLIPV